MIGEAYWSRLIHGYVAEFHVDYTHYLKILIARRAQ